MSPSTQILDQFVPFNLSSPPITSPQLTDPLPTPPKDNGLHERLYQTATTQFKKTRIGSEEFQESITSKPSSSSTNESGIGLWASGRNESGIGALQQPQKRSMWLVADAELVVYGSTDPSAQLTIGVENVI